MFAQANSEHCRHKIFNAQFVIDGQEQPQSMFGMIRHTERQSPAAHGRRLQRQRGGDGRRPHRALGTEPHARFARCPPGAAGRWATRRRRDLRFGQQYVARQGVAHVLMKVETHNHPTAISPYPGRGHRRRRRDPRRGRHRPRREAEGRAHRLLGEQPAPARHRASRGSATPSDRPAHIASALQIMIDGPLGGAAFNNEFGRPNLGGYFRVYEQTVAGVRRGYHKPIMIAGGLGAIEDGQTHKLPFPAGTLLVQLGGPGMRIGMGGGAASSMAAGSNTAALDFDSVQRGNPEIQRRAQEVINHCWAWVGGQPDPRDPRRRRRRHQQCLSRARRRRRQGRALRPARGAAGRKRPGAEGDLVQREPGALRARGRARALLPLSSAMCERERCPFAVVGRRDRRAAAGARRRPGRRRGPIDMPMDVLLGKPPKMQRDVQRVARARRRARPHRRARWSRSRSTCCATRPWRSKRFLVTIGDRTVGGLSHRDPMVGPVAGAGGRLRGHAGRLSRLSRRGDGMGERTPLAALDAPASGRMAVGEAITNLLAAPIELPRVKLSLQLDGGLRRAGRGRGAVRHGARPWAWSCARRWASACRSARIRCRCARAGGRRRARQVTAPVSLIVSAFATLDDVRGTLTPQLQPGDTTLILIDLGAGPQAPGRARCSRRCWASSATTAARPRRSAAPEGAGGRDQPPARATAGCWPTTTAATAACGRRCARWPSPATWA